MTARGWTLARATLLVGAVVLLSPVSPVFLVFVPLALLLLAFRSGDWVSVAIAAVILGLGFAGSRPGGIEWYVPRAWSLMAGGTFVAVTTVQGKDRLLGRALAAVILALAIVLALGIARPSVIQNVDWWVASEIRHAAMVAGGILEQIQVGADPEVRRQLEGAIRRWVAFQQDVYPAMLSLATLAALGLAWFGLERLSGTVRSPGAVRDFRFSDHLVWLLIGGLAMLVLPLGGAAFRVGENAALFMGGLYLLRGTAILVWVGAAAVTSVWSGVLLTVAAVLLYPVVLGTALVLGLSDTWLDLRGRLSRARSDRDN
jgi:hypothetical protein